MTAPSSASVVTRLIAAGPCRYGVPAICRLRRRLRRDMARLAAGGSSRAAAVPAAQRPRDAAARADAQPASPARPASTAQSCASPTRRPGPTRRSATEHSDSRYGTATVAAWNWMHARLTNHTAWLHHDGKLPVIEGTLIQLRPIRCPATASSSRCGCGSPTPAPPPPRSTVLAGVLAPLRPRDEQAAVLS